MSTDNYEFGLSDLRAQIARKLRALPRTRVPMGGVHVSATDIEELAQRLEAAAARPDTDAADLLLRRIVEVVPAHWYNADAEPLELVQELVADRMALKAERDHLVGARDILIATLMEQCVTCSALERPCDKHADVCGPVSDVPAKRSKPGALYQAIVQLWLRRPDGTAPNPVTDPPDETTGVMQETREQTAAFLSDVVLRHWDGVCGCQMQRQEDAMTERPQASNAYPPCLIHPNGLTGPDGCSMCLNGVHDGDLTGGAR